MNRPPVWPRATFALLVLLLAAPTSAQSQPTTQPVVRVKAPASAPVKAATSRPAAPPPAAPHKKVDKPADPYAGLDHTGTPSLPPREITLPPPSAKAGDKRPLPRYDGRPTRSASAGEALIWVPRILFFPAYLVLNYGVRWPLVNLTALAEEHHVFERIGGFFSFADGRATLYPTLFFDFGINPSLGLFFGFNDFGAKNNSLTLQAGVWFNEWLHVIGTDSFKVFRNDEGTVTLRAEFLSRPDRVFDGLNLSSESARERYFRERRVEAEVSLRSYLKGLNRVQLAFYYRNVGTSDGEDFDEDDAIAARTSPYLGSDGRVDTNLVPGYGQSYNLLTTELKVELDSRQPERLWTPGSGVRLELFGRFSFDPSDTKLNFFRYGGDAAVFWDVSGINHVLALRVYAELLENTGDRVVPFTERLVLGGPEYLRGFLEGRFRGDSAFVATLDYRYPIWVLLDANIFVSMGNVFPGRFGDFNVKRMVLSYGFGLRTNTSRDLSFDLLLAFGTNRFERWDEHLSVDNVRFVFGVNQGF